MAGHWQKGWSSPMRHPLVASLFVSLDVADPDMFKAGVLHGPLHATVVFTTRLHDDTTVKAGRQVPRSTRR
ncbi:hypothetical protein [Nonomuraea sp. NPDC049400]|uniref:hypothetical protein n=1 Tax=Nonomuraea sp. NPDC049400 TaxID=3364352 RepID=UPI0037920906